MDKKKKKVNKIIADIDGLISITMLTGAKKYYVTLEDLISRLQAQGVSNDVIRKRLISDLETGGPIFGEFNNSIKKAVQSGISVVDNKASTLVFQDEFGEDYKEIWVLDPDYEHCEDCEERSGEVHTHSDWELLGEPPDWGSICNSRTINCKCRLMPVDINEEVYS